MSVKSLLVMEVLLAMVTGTAYGAPAPSREETATCREWAVARFESGGAAAPFSFVYAGRPSAELLAGWKVDRRSKKIDDAEIRYTTTYTDPDTGLELRCEAVQYSDFPMVEWTLYFRNTGKSDTPILSDIRALDASFERGDQGEFVLHHHRGTTVTAGDFEPFATTLGPSSETRFAPPGGRPLGTVFPYFNLERQGGGMIIAVGWPGQWAAEFRRDEAKGVTVRAGQELTHLKLHPGEEIRSPLIVLQFYNGDWLRAQNIWRRWMLAHNLPRPGGKLPPPQMTPCSSHQYGEMISADEASQKMFIDRYIAEGLKPDYWWMDAGWYVNNGGWPNTGTWEVDTKRFPNGLRAVSDHAHAKGVKIIVWFEPERVTPGTWLWEKHPEWLLGTDPNNRLLDLGNPDALKWLTEHVDKTITEQGIDLYRQDYNIDPLGFWRSTDAEDRQGITENHYITGYLAYWDELRKRHPKMLIDTCASGGHRNDLETLRRSVPLLRSDYIFEPVGQQGHTYGLAFWFPFYGTGVIHTDAYHFRSIMSPAFTPCWDMRRTDLDYATLRKLVSQWREVAPRFFGDYYPLTRYNLDSAQWIAWQFDRPESGDGVVQAFRRSESPYETARFMLQGLDPGATYDVRDVDQPKGVTMTGKELMEKGLQVTIAGQPGAALVEYAKARR